MKISDKKENLCNSRSKSNCPVENKCCLNNVIYQAKVSTSKDDYKVYIGLLLLYKLVYLGLLLLYKLVYIG